MKDKEEFFGMLAELNGQDVREFNRLIGDFDFGRYVLKVNRTTQDGEGAPTLFLVRVPQMTAGFPHQLHHTPVRRTALEDYLTRRIGSLLEQYARFDEEGVARRRISVASPGQKILPRTSVVMMDEYVEARLYVHLPSRAGKILGDVAQEIFFDELPVIVNSGLVYCNLDAADVEEFIDLMEDADHVRQALPTRGLISFVREGSLVSRRGLSDLPDFTHAAGIQMPDALRVDFDTPNAGTVKGLGIPTGITVIVGDEFSGRVELLKAIAAGIYNHVPGDGRELVITAPDAVYVTAESQRSVQRVDISPFIRPDGDSRDYSSSAASSAAAQAASVIEYLEVGARALLFDESDSASGFLAMDSRLAEVGLNSSGHVTPLAAMARAMADELGISIVVGGSSTAGEFAAIADSVLLIENYAIRNITAEVKALGLKHPAAAPAEVAKLLEKVRWVVPSSIDPSVGRHDAQIASIGLQSLQFGRATIDLSGLAQLADPFQTSTIGLILHYARTRYMDEGRPIREVLDLVDRDLSTEGLEILSRDLRGDLARPRRYEIAAALNRLSSLRISHIAE